jgi:cytochrome c-type biogenesis protein CcmH
MTLWLIFALMALCVVAALIGPSLLRRNVEMPGRENFDIAVYKDQLNEVDRDVERGHVSAEEAGTVRLEIQRRLLAAADATDGAVSQAAQRSPVLIVLAILVPTLAGLSYIQVGSPGIPDFPYAERDDLSVVAQGAGDINDMVAGLESRLAQNPDDPEGWAMLGRTYQVLEQYSDAAQAFQKLYDLTSDVRAKSEYAEAMILSNDAVVSAELAQILAQVMDEAPLDPKARFYFGVGVAQQGDLAGAVQVWTDLVHLSPDDASWLPTVQQQIEDAARSVGIDPASVTPSPEAQQLAIAASIDHSAPTGPTVEDMENAATMNAEDQLSMIRSMVQRLADRLAQDPENPEGWMRLIQAYEVLGEMDKAEQTRAAAEPYLP